MPYIPQEQRDKLDKVINQLTYLINIADRPEGTANYVITRILSGGLRPSNYARYNAAIGVLECAKLELYRRTVAEYENKCIDLNGDIPEYSLG